MENFTIKNLFELEDFAPKFGLGDAQEARFATKHLGAEQTGLAFIRIKPGQRPSLAHRHGSQEELYVVVSGSGRAKLDDDVREFAQWDVIRVAPQVTRAFEAGPGGAEILAFGVPAVSGGKNDAEMVQDFWPESDA
ncbi:MAG TPA: hypothetical protein VGO97_00810 [Solirubrobacterales bacterium]|jgi:mannose-6-phosphate isomerase-like protein (cupin superfamily)|nr:hypothetical protein [Solirubrobacterales bacterium]